MQRQVLAFQIDDKLTERGNIILLIKEQSTKQNEQRGIPHMKKEIKLI